MRRLHLDLAPPPPPPSPIAPGSVCFASLSASNWVYEFYMARAATAQYYVPCPALRPLRSIRGGVRKVWPNTRQVDVQVFGSFANGLSTWNSDLDLVVTGVMEPDRVSGCKQGGGRAGGGGGGGPRGVRGGEGEEEGGKWSQPSR